MSKRGPMAATDKRRQAGHKNPRHAGGHGDHDEGNGAGSSLAHLFTDRRKANGSGKRAS